MKSCEKAGLKMAAAVMLVLLLAAGCAKTEVQTDQESEAQSSDAQRYRDTVFEVAMRESDILYRTAENLEGETIELLLDAYWPKGDMETNRPAVILMHAGGFTFGAKDAGIEPILAKDFAKNGLRHRFNRLQAGKIQLPIGKGR